MCALSKMLGKPDARRVGAGLGSLAERYGNHPVHLLPAGRRTGLHASARRNHLRHRAPGDGAAECGKRIRSDLDARLALPAYEMTLKAAHIFNLLDARGAISVTERAAYMGRIRALSRRIAQTYYEARAALGFPLLATSKNLFTICHERPSDREGRSAGSGAYMKYVSIPSTARPCITGAQ